MTVRTHRNRGQFFANNGGLILVLVLLLVTLGVLIAFLVTEDLVLLLASVAAGFFTVLAAVESVKERFDL